MSRSPRMPARAVAVLAGCLSCAVAAAAADHRGLQLYRTLPADPLLVLAVHVDEPAVELGRMFETLGRLSGEDGGTAAIEEFGAALTRLLPREVLDSIGPEIVVSVDLPPIDEAVEAIQASRTDTLDLVLGRIGLLAGVRDAPRLDAALRGMLAGIGAGVEDAGRLVHARLAVSEAPGPVDLNVFYGIRKNRLALGFSRSWVEAMVEGQRPGRRLVDGEDFARVFSRLDARPTDLAYVNLPRLREYVTGSKVVHSLAGANPEIAHFVEHFFTPETMGVGLGSTSVVLEHGVRTTNFGPPWMSGAVMSGGFLAAMALPDLLATVDAGRARRTVHDIEAIAEACEGFSLDSESYPGPTDGWVPVDSLSAYLEPVYIGTLPRRDAWENPLLYWSDGGSYRILSTGKDGRMDRDWSSLRGGVAGGPALAGDIVYGDGRLLAVTRHLSAE